MIGIRCRLVASDFGLVRFDSIRFVGRLVREDLPRRLGGEIEGAFGVTPSSLCCCD